MHPSLSIVSGGPASGAWSQGQWQSSTSAAPSIIRGSAANAILHAAPTSAILGGPAGNAIMRGAAVDVSA